MLRARQIRYQQICDGTLSDADNIPVELPYREAVELGLDNRIMND